MSVCWAESETPETRIKKVHRMRSGTRLILSPHGVDFAHAADAIENKIIPRPRNIGETWSTTMLRSESMVVPSTPGRSAKLRQPRSERSPHGDSAQAPACVLLQLAEARSRPEFLAAGAPPERLRLAPLGVFFL